MLLIIGEEVKLECCLLYREEEFGISVGSFFERFL